MFLYLPLYLFPLSPLPSSTFLPFLFLYIYIFFPLLSLHLPFPFPLIHPFLSFPIYSLPSFVISRHFHFPIYSSYLPSSYLLIPPSFFNSLPPLPLPIYSSWSPPPSSSAHLPYFPLLMNSSVPLPFLQLHKIIYPSSSQRSSLSSTVLPPLHLYTLSSLSESSKAQKDTINLTYHQARQSQRDQSWPFLKRFSLSFAFPS